MSRLPVVICNPLRQDDGMGWRAAELIEARITKGAADVSVCHQLTPRIGPKTGGSACSSTLPIRLREK